MSFRTNKWRQAPPPLHPQNSTIQPIERGLAESTEKLRKNFLEEIKEHITGTLSTDSNSRFNDSLKKCSYDSKERHRTILHWIVAEVERLDEKRADTDEFIQAAEQLVAIAMKFDEKLISQIDQEGGTALHHAISSNDSRVLPLITTMCSFDGVEANREHLRKAIAHPNNLGENCLHISIKLFDQIHQIGQIGQIDQVDHFNQRSNILDTLISIADEAAFSQKRKRRTNGSDPALPNDGNTPLHDAVKYDSGVIMQPKCTKSNDGKRCENCNYAFSQFQSKRSYVTKLVTTMIERYNLALKMKNDNDESPYLYYLRTKGEYKHDEALVKSHSCPMEPNNEASSTIEKQLIESAFIVGGFKDACACFFGDKTDEDGKSSPLRPGYPITEKSSTIYDSFIPKGTGVLSHVDLRIGKSAALYAEKPASSMTQDAGGSISLQQEAKPSNRMENHGAIGQWKKDMKSLTDIFSMLRRKGVKRILKVTIKDNQKRPCSDQVIQQCLAPFDVRYLDWNKPDLNISIIYASCPKIAELTLYSSGRRAVLDSWVASTGLCRLRQLMRLNLNAVAGLEEYGAYKTLMDHFQTELIENVRLTRRKLVLASKWEECKLDIQDLKTLVEDSTNMGDSAAGNDYKKHLKNEEDKYQIYQKQLLLLQEEGADLENQRLNNLLTNFRGDKNTATGSFSQASKNHKSIEGSNGATALSNRQDDDAKASHPAAANASISSGSASSRISRNMLQKWSYNDGYNGAPNKESKLFRDTSKVDDYSPGCLMSLEFQVRIFMEEPPRDAIAMSIFNDGSMSQTSDTLESNRWLQAVERFVQNLVQTAEKGDDDTIKVAVIDDGIDIRHFDGLVHRPGWPPAKPDSDETLWYHSENGHGTIMAQMIHRMCPRVYLFVAKLGDYHNPRKMENADKAAEAITWAIEKKVSIISMSWSLVASNDNRKGIERLDSEIRRAADAGILLYCAAADKGPFVENAELFPHRSRTQHIRIVGSAKEGGGESHFVDRKQVHYLFPGERIDYVGKREGSSIATALAAGFAALILWCFKYNNEDMNDIASPEGMHNVFLSLMKHQNKWVNAADLLGIDNPKDIEDVVRHCQSAVLLKPSEQNDLGGR